MILTTNEAAQRLGCSPDNVRRLEREGKLKAEKTATGRRIFHSQDVERFLENKAQIQELVRQKKAA